MATQRDDRIASSPQSLLVQTPCPRTPLLPPRVIVKAVLAGSHVLALVVFGLFLVCDALALVGFPLLFLLLLMPLLWTVLKRLALSMWFWRYGKLTTAELVYGTTGDADARNDEPGGALSARAMFRDAHGAAWDLVFTIGSRYESSRSEPVSLSIVSAPSFTERPWVLVLAGVDLRECTVLTPGQTLFRYFLHRGLALAVVSGVIAVAYFHIPEVRSFVNIWAFEIYRWLRSYY